MRRFLVLVVCAVAAASQRAEARPPVVAPGLCSVGGGSPPFSIARTQNIVAEAQVIVRATVLGEESGPAGDGRGLETEIVFAVHEVLRGFNVPDTLRIIGSIRNEDAVPPEFVEEVPHRSYIRRWSGSCAAMTYTSGGEYLLLAAFGVPWLARPYWVLLAPTNNQIGGADDRWLLWVRAEIARNPPRP